MLLEVIVALAILAIGGASMILLASSSLDAIHRTRAAEQDGRRASAFLDAVALWPRADLDRHLGVRSEGRWDLRVARPEPTLYLVVLYDSADVNARHSVLATALYRPVGDDETR